MPIIDDVIRDANAFCRKGDLAAAERLCAEAIVGRPEDWRLRYLLGCVYAQSGQAALGLPEIELAARYQPRSAMVQSTLGEMFLLLDRMDEAVTAFQRSTRLDPTDVQAHLKLIDTLRRQRKLAYAESAARRALEVAPNDADLLGSLGLILTDLGRATQAIELCSQAASMRPMSGELRMLLANAYRCSGMFEEAVEHGRIAVNLDPSPIARSNLGVDELRTGRLREGWHNREARDELPRFRYRCKAPKWDGSRLSGGTLLVRAEGGLGDTIQHVRFLPAAAERAGGSIVLAFQPELMDLLADTPGVTKLTPRSDNTSAPDDDFEYQISLLSLPAILETSEETIPRVLLPVRHCERAFERWRDRLSGLGGLRVGLRWAGNPAFVEDSYRSIPLATFAPLFEMTGVTFVSLQVGSAADEVQRVSERCAILNWPEGLSKWTETAALLRQLDLVISTCTSVPHLAGAMGVETWLLTSFTPNWCWNVNRPNDTPWYPSHRLFRQPRLNDWEEVIERVRRELIARVHGRAADDQR